MGVSPDGRWLYHADTANHLVRRWALDGSQAEPEVHVHFGSGLPDGLAVDAAGALWVAMVSAGTVQQVRPDGTLGTTIEVPSRMVTSCAFGGDGLADLYIVTGSGSSSGHDGAIYRTRVDAVGLPVPLCRV
jgi:sugar lactone lactonase YvrE